VQPSPAPANGQATPDRRNISRRLILIRFPRLRAAPAPISAPVDALVSIWFAVTAGPRHYHKVDI
jgi:hypothetical protein